MSFFENVAAGDNHLPKRPKHGDSSSYPDVRLILGRVQQGISNIMDGWATIVNEFDHNDKVEMKIHAVWNLTRHLEPAIRLVILEKLRKDYESTYRNDRWDIDRGEPEFKTRKRLKWAVIWIDQMIKNVKTGEEFDESFGFEADRY
jgi:hypothetical protein